MTVADIGLVGLGVMGANLALNMAEKGHTVAVFNRTPARTQEFLGGAGALGERIVPTASLEELVRAIRPPRPVILMIKAGPAVDEQAETLAPHLGGGDILIDTGNANFRDTQRRCQTWSARKVAFLGVGVSGGEEGARNGPSIMGGGPEDAWRRIAPIFEGIAAQAKGRACCARVGPDGSGHFVKTIHNGIEYADMQMIAEAYGLMRDGLGLSPDRMAAIFAAWNGGPLQSYLIEITARVLEARDSRTGGPLVDAIVDKAGQKGTGRWSAIEAQDLGTPATVIEAAVAARSWAAEKVARIAGERLFGRPAGLIPGDLGSETEAIGTLEDALLAGRIIAYAQGFAVMQAASLHWQWSLPLGTIAEIWRAGCIIRSAFLDDIAAVYGRGEGADTLTRAPHFAGVLKKTESALRRAVAAGVRGGLPVPALASALAYFDYMRTARSTADLIQGQRDFFGAHGFEHRDRPGEVAHGPWSNAQG